MTAQMLHQYFQLRQLPAAAGWTPIDCESRKERAVVWQQLWGAGPAMKPKRKLNRRWSAFHDAAA